MKIALLLLAALAALVGVSMILQRLANPDAYEEEPEAKPEPGPKATLELGRVATIETNRGTIRFVLYEKDMPITCRNFLQLAEKGFYNGLKFHRVESWVVQTGDPKGDGIGSGKTIPLETKSGLDFQNAHMVGMARTEVRDSATSQFFIAKIPKPDLQSPPKGPYACFGQVFEGQEVVDKLKKGDVMKKLTVSSPTKKDRELIKRAQNSGPAIGRVPQPPPPASGSRSQ